MKVVGIIGGMGWEGAATYYRVMNRQVRAELGGWHSARVILDSLEFHAIAQAQSRKDFAYVRQTLIESARRLERAGAEALVVACNTVHRFAPAIVEAVSIPLLHIADAAGEALRQDGHTCVGLLGTQATMRGKFLRHRLTKHFGLDILTPQRPTQAALHAMILNELAAGSVPSACASRLDSMVQQLVQNGATAVLLACTEFGLAYGSVDAPRIERALPQPDSGQLGGAVPLYDTAVLHAHAAVRYALVP